MNPDGDDRETTSDDERRGRLRLVRGLIAVSAAVTVAVLLRSGLAQPWPDAAAANAICALVGGFGLVDLLRAAR